MKRFIISALCISVFFIGLGSIVEKTSAKFTSDDRALELIKNARIAIGGESNINEVKSMTIVASTTNFFEREGVQDVKQGSLEINMKLPGQFSKRMNIGTPGEATTVDLTSDSDFVFTKKNGETIDLKSMDGAHKKGVFVIKKGDGAEVEVRSTDGNEDVEENVFVVKKGDKNVEWKTNADGKVRIDGDKIIITKDDGTTEEIKLDGKHKIHLKKQDGAFITDDGNVSKVVVMKDKDGKVLTENIVGPNKFKFAHGGHNGDMIRTTFALLLKTPDGINSSFKYLGEGNVDGNASNIIEVTAKGNSFKLYLDAATSLPQMITYQAPNNVFFFKKGDTKDVSENVVVEMKKKLADTVEHQVKFSDYRSAGNLLLPHSWTKSVNGKQSQNTNITSFDINPANIDDKFKHRKVFVQKRK